MLSSIILGLACMGCMDDVSPTLAKPEPGVPWLSASLECTVDRASASMMCTEPQAPGHSSPSPALLSGGAIKMRSANFVADSLSEIWAFDATAQNLLSYAVGTPDGQTKTGLKVFFVTGPTGRFANPGDTGTVSVRNPDGHQNFTGPQQPYHFYDTILSPQETTYPKRWEFNVPRNVVGFSFSVRIFTTTPRETPVPAEVPDLRPSRYDAPSSYRWCDISGYGECVYDAVMVNFQRDVTREERQSAIDGIGGVVEGGSPGLASYYVRIPPDTTLVGLRTALTHLRKLPQVDYAIPVGVIPGSTFYRSPDDGTYWNQWELDDSLATGRNWALETISAPWAWGCEVGDASTAVAVVDTDFHLVGDIIENAQVQDSVVGRLTAAADSTDHGTFVASVLSARGGNTTGITGVAWKSSMRLYEVANTDSAGNLIRDSAAKAVLSMQRMTELVYRAALDGASVINLSMGIDWTVIAKSRGWITTGTYDPGTETNPARIALRDTIVSQLSSFMVDAIDAARFSPTPRHPLVVLAAGNDGIDAQWTGFAKAAASRPDNMIVVGAGGRIPGQGGLQPTSFTNHGSLLEIAAPGGQVWGLDRNGQKLWSGTSFAAPYVTGAAALLLAFDPRLEQKPDTLKSLLLEGARSGGRLMQNGTTGSIPVLNVHRALQAAARRTGAPLCGNRLWSAGGTVYAQRDTATVTGEALFTLPSSSGSPWFSFNALHGGKLVHAVGAGTFMREWTPAGWVNAALPPEDTYPAGSNATMYSRYASSHGGDSSVTVLADRSVANTVTFSLRLRDERTATSVVLPQTISSPDYAGVSVCLRELTSAAEGVAQGVADSDDAALQEAFAKFQQWVQTRPCVTTGGRDSFRFSRGWAVYSPRGDRAYVFVTQQAGSTSTSGYVACTTTYPLQWDSVYWNMPVDGYCRNSATSAQSAGTKIYQVVLRTGAITAVSWGEADAELRVPALREDGKEWVVDRFTRREGWRYDWVGGANYPTRTSSPTVDTCVVQYRTVASGSVLLEPSGAMCEQYSGDRGISASQQPGLP